MPLTDKDWGDEDRSASDASCSFNTPVQSDPDSVATHLKWEEGDAYASTLPPFTKCS